MLSRRSLSLVALAASLVAGCWNSVIPADGGPIRREAGTGYLPDGADPFQQVDASDGGYLDPESGVWITPDVVTGTNDERYGYISLGSNGTADSTASYAGASFRLHYIPEDPACMMIAYGSWNMDDCPTSTMQRDNEPRPLPNAGRIEIRGGRETVTLTPNRTNGEYNDYYENSDTFFAGASLELRATGATVPEFTRRFRVPGDLHSMVEANGVVRRNDPLTVTWQPLESQLVYVSLYQSYELGGVERAVRLTGLYPADELRETIPAVLMMRFQANRPVYVSMRSYNVEEFDVANWPITIYVSGRGSQQLFDVQ